MATLISVADGSLNGAAVFATTVTSTGALNLIRFNQTTTHPAAGTTTSVAFTVTNAAVVDGVLLWCRQGGVGSTGTMKVGLNKGGVEQASVTINKEDLPPFAGNENHPVFFKFTGTATGDGAANWTIVVVTTGVNAVYISPAVSGITNMARALRTITLATPAAADDLYIVGELTGAGTHNSRAIVMNSTSVVVYGSGAINSTTVNGGILAVSNWASLTYANAAGVDYVLRLAGDLRVQHNGTLTIGSAGAEIPRTSTAILEFQPTAADAFGLICSSGSTFSAAGLSRTAGKDIDRCKLSANFVGTSSLISAGSLVNSTTVTSVDSTGNSLMGVALADNATSGAHGMYYAAPAVTNVVQTAHVWLMRASGLNNRYVRLSLVNATNVLTATHGIFVDIDLQAGTLGTPGVVGTGAVTSASITPVGPGFQIKLTGRVSTSSATPHMHVNACAVAGTLSYIGNVSYCFIYDFVALYTGIDVPSASFSVDTDTGWLAGDAFAVSSTSNIGTDANIFPLGANAGVSSLATPMPSGVSYGGVAPIQAEVILITRNVKIRSTSTAWMMYIHFAALATATLSWVEIHRNGGTGTGVKQGIFIYGGATANPKTITYCSIHDNLTYGIWCEMLSLPSINVNVSNNVFWCPDFGFYIDSTVANNDWVFHNNIIMRATDDAVTLYDAGGVLTNNTICSSGAVPCLILGAAVTGTINNNLIHSGGTYGLSVLSNAQGTISNLTIWRMDASGINISVNTTLIFNNLVVFGSDTYNFNIAASAVDITIQGSSIISGDVGRPVANGIYHTYGGSSLKLIGVDMSGVGFGGVLAPHTLSDINVFSSPYMGNVAAANCKFGAPNLLAPASKGFWGTEGYMYFQKYNQTPGDHRTEMKYGQIKTDQTIFNTAAPSLRLTPINATNKLKSAPVGQGVLVPVANGFAINVSVYVRKSEAADGVLYNGNQPRLIQRANPALGQNSDVVLATFAAAPGNWSLLSATSSIANDDGVWEFIIDCDGTSGWVNVDDWEFTGAATTANGMKNWFNGHPVVGSGGGGGGGTREFFSISLT